MLSLTQLKKLNDSALRGAFCAVWVFGIIFAFYEFLYAITADSGSPEQRTFVIHTITCLGVAVVAALVHAYLMGTANE